MNKSIFLLYQRAQQMGLPLDYSADLGRLEIILGRKHYYFVQTITPLNEAMGVYICKNKFIANRILLNAGFPVAKAVAVSQADLLNASLGELINGLRFPLVAKPIENTSRGVNVMCNIKTLDVLEEHVSALFGQQQTVQIEEFHTGLKEYRVLVLKNRVIGVVERFAASVIGDGVRSVKELIAKSNEARARLNSNLTISPLVYDREYELCLEEQGLSLTSIIPNGKKIRLCYTANTGRGGDIQSLGKKIHPQNSAYLCRALRETGLLYGGFDVLCEDINLPFDQTQWMIVEINHNPDLTIHEIPHQGTPIAVSKTILWQLVRRHPLSYLYHLSALLACKWIK